MRRNLFFLVCVLWLTSDGVSAVGGIDKAPAPAAPREARFTQPKEAKLPNGLRIVVAERPDLPLLTTELIVRHGSEIDPTGRGGAASMAGSLLTRGTNTMPAPEIARTIESLGGTIFSAATWDSSMAGVVVMSDKEDAALNVLADVVQHPAFQSEEIERLRRQTLDRLRVSLEQPGNVNSYVVTRVVFREGEYAHPSGGTTETIQAITRDDIVKLYQSYYRPEASALVFSGNVTLEQAKAYAEKYFGDWKASPEAAAAPFPVSANNENWKAQKIVVDMPQAGQAAVSIARPAIKRSSPDFYTAEVANAALGSGFVSRLNREIRINRGLSYGAGSSFSMRRDAGAFSGSAQTKNESAVEVATLLQEEIKRLATDPVQGEELKSRQAMLAGSFARNMETNQEVAGQLGSLVVYDLPLDSLDKYIPGLSAVTSDGIADFVHRTLNSPMGVVIVGKASVFKEALAKAGPGWRIIPQADVDLNRAELTKTK